MNIIVREAAGDDVPALTELYAGLEGEMVALKPVWRLVDGLPHPAQPTVAQRVDDPRWLTYVAELDGAIVGFLFARDEEMLPQAGGERIASIRHIYTDIEAREVGVGEALMDRFLEDARLRGIGRFDAHVSPGHRLAKNFFEANGFKARSIVMHRSNP
jgi:ribosomal protein S18 acetylase RimI-like enzyme